MTAQILGVDYIVPDEAIANDQLARSFPAWNIEKSAKTTGVAVRHVAKATEYTSDLAAAAGLAFLEKHLVEPTEVDYLILCTQTPDYYLPTTAIIVHHQLGLRAGAGAVDVTLGCSGYVYSLGLAAGLIESRQVKNVLVLTADTLSKVTNPEDRATIPIFGDAAAATYITSDSSADGPGLQGFVYGTDGSGAANLIVPNGGLRDGTRFSPKSSVDVRGLADTGHDLFMDGAEIFNFTIATVPRAVQSVLDKSHLALADIDLFVFHQANRFMIEHLRKKLGVPTEKFVTALENVGNTSSSSIPIALADAERDGRLRSGSKVLILGFGVGYSWAGAILTW